VVVSLHKKYGTAVRIAPNHVSINEPDALTQVYSHKSGFTKGPFYDAFMQVRPVIFNAREVSVHQRKRKYLNPAFSNRGLADFEAYMDVEIQDWVDQLNRMSRSKMALDLCVWSMFWTQHMVSCCSH
jgi:benzoate 4-monooxygenase